jgi:hypothetical protein
MLEVPTGHVPTVTTLLPASLAPHPGAGTLVLETARLDEFAPIKNAHGEDSPESSHRLQTERAAEWLAALLDSLAATAALNKTVLVKGWPGPITLPIGPFGPSWPASCGAGDGGDSHAARGAAAVEWFTPSYALFLLAVEPTVFWSYSWWYDLHDGYYPPANSSMANTTSAPLGWYPDLARPLGTPLGPAVQGQDWVYTRSFERANVTVDLADYKTATISWF